MTALTLPETTYAKVEEISICQGCTPLPVKPRTLSKEALAPGKGNSEGMDAMIPKNIIAIALTAAEKKIELDCSLCSESFRHHIHDEENCPR